MPSARALRFGKAVIELSMLKGDVEKQLKTLERGFRDFGTKLKSIGSQMMAFGAGLGVPLVAAIKLAADAQENLAKFRAVFGDQAAAADAFAASMASSLGRSVHDTKSAGTANQRDAERAAAKWEAELREGRYQKPQRMTWAEFREQFAHEYLDGLKVGTAAAYEATLNVFESLSRPGRLAELTTARLTAFVTLLRERRRKPATIARHLRALKVAARWAHRQGLLHKLPQFDMPKHQKGMKHRAVTGEEIDRLVAAAPKAMGEAAGPSWAFYLRGLSLSGLRLAESLQLRWDDAPGALVVDLGGRRPMLRIPAESEKGGAHRLLPIPPDFAALLDTVPQCERKGFVFRLLSKAGQPLTRSLWAVGDGIKAIAVKAGVVVGQREKLDVEGEPVMVNDFASAHDLRRAFGVRWARRVMPTVLRELMRHATVETTMRYYVGVNAEATADALWAAEGITLGITAQNADPQDAEENAVSR